MTLAHWYVPSLITSIFFLLGMITLYWLLADRAIHYVEQRRHTVNQEHVRTIVGLLYMAIFILCLQLLVGHQQNSWVFMNFQLFAVVFVSYFLLLNIKLWQWGLTAVLFMIINGTFFESLSWLYTLILIVFFFIMKLLKRHKQYNHWDFINYLVITMGFSAILWGIVAWRLQLSPKLVGAELGYMLIMLTIVYFYINLLYRDAATLAQLTYSTNFDELTHAKNYFAFRTNFGHDFEDDRTQQRPFTIMLFDIDHFKTINDTYGHLAGDYVLTRLAGLIEAYLHELDSDLVLYRTGGEEFTILFNNYSLATTLPQAQAIAELIRTADFNYDHQPIHVSISVGLTQQRVTDDDSTALYKRADNYLYQSKNHGRDQVTAK
ncbi:GGDEF domain-containing protein [Lactobacillus sp. CBA3606]|uniref:GGDEF domain-containing protein n=1 Tax=Lactobacillus sp. CBA3606 TaxID=2099789 RepID=UPI000CFBE8C4|nr:GGDEF domain-containing protein [Lactobacillus sp. CBA3606]AVK63938.1 GGDEF domain-containing protein [Lactobacillus sp. CBA3606]